MKLLVDVCLSPQWVPALLQHGYTAIHWSTVGQRTAPDAVLTAWARAHDHIVLTHDLDFGALLAACSWNSPSVLILRCADVSPAGSLSLVLATLQSTAEFLRRGALISIDEHRSRVRVLPIFRQEDMP